MIKFIHMPTSGYISIAEKLPAHLQPVTMLLSNGNEINYNYQGYDDKLAIVPLYWKPIKRS